MRMILLVGLFLLLGFNQAFSAITRIEQHQLSISGVPMVNTVVATSTTVTTDSVYQAGSQTNGYAALATIINGANVKLTYQTSYDNINWFSPVTTNGSGTVTAQSTLDSVTNGNTWVIYSYTVYPYIRWNFAVGSTGTSAITAETLWQDWS